MSTSRLALVMLVAQVPAAHAEPRAEVGGYAGYTTAKTHTSYDNGDSGEPHYAEPGITVGASVRYAVRRGVLVGADLSYTQKGINDGPSGTHTTYHYLEAPLLAELDAGRASSSRARLFAYAGLAPAVRVACTVNGPVSLDGSATAVDYYGACEDLPFRTNIPNRLDLGLVIGVGLGWELPFATIDVQARATRGLVDTEGDGGAKTINTVFAILLDVRRAI
jgi:hypothetical protein